MPPPQAARPRGLGRGAPGPPRLVKRIHNPTVVKRARIMRPRSGASLRRKSRGRSSGARTGSVRYSRTTTASWSGVRASLSMGTRENPLERADLSDPGQPLHAPLTVGGGRGSRHFTSPACPHLRTPEITTRSRPTSEPSVGGRSPDGTARIGTRRGALYLAIRRINRIHCAIKTRPVLRGWTRHLSERLLRGLLYPGWARGIPPADVASPPLRLAGSDGDARPVPSCVWGRGERWPLRSAQPYHYGPPGPAPRGTIRKGGVPHPLGGRSGAEGAEGGRTPRDRLDSPELNGSPLPCFRQGPRSSIKLGSEKIDEPGVRPPRAPDRPGTSHLRHRPSIDLGSQPAACSNTTRSYAIRDDTGWKVLTVRPHVRP